MNNNHAVFYQNEFGTTHKVGTDLTLEQATKLAGQVKATKGNATIEAFMKWCECEGDTMSNAYYVGDNEMVVPKKHHWRCSKCNHVLQIG